MRRPVDISVVVAGYRGDRNRLKKVLRALRDQGWGIQKGRHHFILVAPDGRSMGFSKGSGDWRALRNLESQVRGMGAKL